MSAPADDPTRSSSPPRRRRRAVEVPSAELRQALRLAVLHPGTAAQRAETVQDLVAEMVDATTQEAGPITVAELASCAAVSDAIAAHVDRMRQMPLSPARARAAAPRSRS